MLRWLRREPKSTPAARSGGIEIRDPWARVDSAMPLRAGGFFAVTNSGTAPDRLLAATSPVAEKVEIHAIKVVGAGITMGPLPDGLFVPADSTLTLKPHGYHLLLTGLAAPLAVAARVPITLQFEGAGHIDFELAVAAPGVVGNEILEQEAHRE